MGQTLVSTLMRGWGKGYAQPLAPSFLPWVQGLTSKHLPTLVPRPITATTLPFHPAHVCALLTLRCSATWLKML